MASNGCRVLTNVKPCRVIVPTADPTTRAILFSVEIIKSFVSRILVHQGYAFIYGPTNAYGIFEYRGRQNFE